MMSGLKFFHILLFFPICFILSQEAFQTRSITSLTQETTELRDVFLNKTCISIISLPSTDFQTNTSNIKIFNIQITPKSYDLLSQKVELDGYEASIIFTGGNAELDVSFQYIMNTTNESTTGGGSGEISLRNLSNHKHISVVNYKPEFFTSNLGIESLNLTLNSKNPIEVNTNFQNLYGSNFGLIITVLQANISSCLNNWFYPEESFNFFKTYLYNYKENIITYKYLLTNLLFGTNHIGFWYNAQIDNYTKGRTINLNPTNIIKQIPTNSNANTFYGRSILYHSIANALEKKLFDLNLNEIEYPSSHFDYFIGEIALFMPSIRKAFYADERISGFCKILNPANATYDLIENLGFFVVLPYFCSINEETSNTNIFNFSISLNFTLTPSIKERIMDVIIADVRSVENSLIWFERKEFPQTSPEIVNYHLDRFLKEMLMGKTFGSNFKVKGDTFNITKEAIVFTISN